MTVDADVNAMRILSLDPGGTTGVAVFETDAINPPQLVLAEQVQDGLQGFIAWAKQNSNLDVDLVVCESFTLRIGVKFPDLSPVYIIGALEAIFSGEIVYQAPLQKPLCDDKRLKLGGIYQVGKPHANDAIRHGIIYLRNKRHLPTLIKFWPQED